MILINYVTTQNRKIQYVIEFEKENKICDRKEKNIICDEKEFKSM